VDAILRLQTGVVLIEAKVERESHAIGQLIMYADLLGVTPEWEWTRDFPVRVRLVSPVIKPDIDNMARRLGIEVVHYSPKWILEYLARLKIARRE